MAQVLEHLPGKHKALNSTPSTKNERKKEKKNIVKISTKIDNIYF
jgi:hypothetical protein